MKRICATGAAAASLALGAACATILGIDDFIDATTSAGTATAAVGGHGAAAGGTVTGGGGQGGSGPLQPGDVVWVRQLGGPQPDSAAGVATAAGGIIAVAGSFFASLEMAGVQLVEGFANSDGYVVLLNADGEHVWTYPIVGAAVDRVSAVTADPYSNFVVVGSFQQSIEFPTPDAGTMTESAVRGFDIFVVQLEPNGEYRWHRWYGDKDTSGQDQLAHGVAADSQGAVLFGGTFDGSVEIATTMSCNNGAGGNYTGLTDAYGAKLDGNGDAQWNQPLGLWGEQSVLDVAASEDDRVVAVGRYDGRIGNQPATGDPDAFVALLSAVNGNVMQVRGYGDGTAHIAHGVATDDAGNIVVVGQFNGAIDFHEDAPDAGTALQSNGTDMFIARLQSNLDHRWSKPFGGTGVDVAYDVAVDPQSGRIAVTGAVQGEVDFGDGPTSGGLDDDVFVLLLTAGGALVWAERFGGVGDQVGRAVAFDEMGFVIVHGDVAGTADFDGRKLSVAPGDRDVFVVKLSP